jgi:hypothetical protein
MRGVTGVVPTSSTTPTTPPGREVRGRACAGWKGGQRMVVIADVAAGEEGSLDANETGLP